jgi:glycosyltransferase involved in cell wall biosynthesis
MEGLASGPRPLETIGFPVVSLVEEITDTVGPGVTARILQDDITSYTEAAHRINTQCPAQAVSIQHEFGIFGGDDGEYVIALLEALNKPVVTTFHTVLRRPSRRVKTIVRAIAGLSKSVVVMVKAGKELLQELYDIDPSMVVTIPHGVPTAEGLDREVIRKELSLCPCKVLSTIGLINPGKGVEYVIEAVSRLFKEFPDIIYLVVGQTHPVVRRKYGESYREHLQEVAHRIGVEGNVRFVNEYLSQQDLLRYLVATDVYVAPYLNEEQISSGTLAYALAMGRAVVSTPFIYAREVLEGGRGLFSNFTDARSLAAATGAILRSPDLQRDLEARAVAYRARIQWPNVARCYRDVFRASLRGTARRVATMDVPVSGRRHE